ncbi:hypothetical protein [Legionella cardiaca]|uniref:SecA family profile domain-containing protein n=1 Tax=Legionella cardiaca TaxID=1071983 RepID=A0ABY8ATX7_9GAMM|nr:hypothetical protein [Legionella cardiaca]WED43646.1 hypothetical protein PXX05_02395 [Legionella cardiaca]
MAKFVKITSTEATSFNDQLYKFAEISDSKVHLFVNKDLSNEELEQFELFIQTKTPFPFNKISLQVDNTLIQKESFLKIIQAFNKASFSSLELVFPHHEVESISTQIVNNLTALVAPLATYPIQVREYHEEAIRPSKLALEEFQAQIIKKIQEKNKMANEVEEQSAETQKPTNPHHPLSKPIKLKQLVGRRSLKDNVRAEYIQLEVQHVETVEQQVVHQEVIEVNVHAQSQQIQQYEGQLIGYSDFQEPIYKKRVEEAVNSQQVTEELYTLLKTELFANLPHAIKYLSPQAAEQLAHNLPGFVTLNKENLPTGFLLKKTDKGELVLDYDAFLENENGNPFTPVEFLDEDDYRPIYDIELKEDIVRNWIDDPELSAVFLPNDVPYNTPKQLVNMWIKYGDEGVCDFFLKMRSLKEKNPTLISFLYQNYLCHFPQWDHFAKNGAFFDCLERISHYDEKKLTCLMKFLEYTGSSRHDLLRTVTAFEFFWNEITSLCIEKKIEIDQINSGWSTPVGGNPVVYMERVLFLLNNARNLQDQLLGLHNLYLTNYGAYYAAKYEEFKSVSARMKFNYHPDWVDPLPFNLNFQLYRAELDNLCERFEKREEYGNICLAANYDEDHSFWLINCEKETPSLENLKQLQEKGLAIPFDSKKFVPPYQLYKVKNDQLKLLLTSRPQAFDAEALSFRFIGQQSSGITVSSFASQFDKFKQGFWSKYNFSTILLGSLFFISHERFTNKPLGQLFDCLEKSSIHKHVVIGTLNQLRKLYKLDIKLNEAEGLMLLVTIAGMNSAEFEGTGLSKDDSIKKLLTYLQENKLATFKFFRFRVEKSSPKWPFLYALDTAEFLAEDASISAMYHDDLLLFSGLINSQRAEAYYHARQDNNAGKIKENLILVRSYLQQAVTQPGPNNFQYAIQVLIQSGEYFSYQQFLDACAEIEALPSFDAKKVDDILKHHKFRIGAQLPEIFTRDNADLKALMISLILQLDAARTTEASVGPQATSFTYEALATKSISELQPVLKQKWQEAGVLLSIVGKQYLERVLKTTKELSIQEAFELHRDTGLLKVVGKKIVDLPDFQDHSDFEKVNLIVSEAETIASLFKQILKNPYVIEKEQEFVALFENFNFAKIDYENLFALLTLFTSMPQRNYLELVKILLGNSQFKADKKQYQGLLDHLTRLNSNCFPTSYLTAFSNLVMMNPEEESFSDLTAQMITTYSKDNRDPILEFAMTQSALSYQMVKQIMTVSEGIENNRDKISKLLSTLIEKNKLEDFLKELASFQPANQKKILEIMAKSHAVERAKSQESEFNYTTLLSSFKQVSDENLEILYQFFATTVVSSPCLLNALNTPNINDDFQNFLLEFEKAPFGKRDLQQQFDCSEVERVINSSCDFINDSTYTYQYRKQLMEAFSFVNQIGNDLPVYHNKAAKDLTNAEISSFFADLKAKKIPQLSPFQNRLLALGLMREAMYRSTGEFPYSTQIIALIDGIMHEGDFISNIDTGQGKSLIDSMKAALLWLDSDRVDLSTSSIVDAKRDIANYGSFLKLLNIPYSEKPITSSSAITDFQPAGINFSTFAQLSLFFSKAKVLNIELDTPSTRVSLVTNESDYTLLDDRVIYRFASPDGVGLGLGQEWMYYAINDFVNRPEFIFNKKTSALEDIDDLKTYLKVKAAELKKSAKIINKFSNEQYLSWIESALLVNYELQENQDFVIPEEFEKRVVGGIEFRSKVAKILMTDDKVSPDSTFGNGMQQLLYARLNKERNSTDFVIEPQTRTIISTNNKNLLTYYRSKQGFIWGSSGTVGSKAEIQEQYKKYGFEFSKNEPHQEKRVKFNKPEVLLNEAEQFKKLIERLTVNEPHGKSAPSIVFCRDINTATRLFNALASQNPKQFPVQLYTGLGKEEDYIKKAGQSGMITITTSALGRNTDIPYNKEIGLHVWHTFIDSTRGSGQKSGRTGRQGSEGEVDFILNKEELGDRSIEEITDEIEALSAAERSFNEDYYDVLGYLLAQVECIPTDHFTHGKTAFFQNVWAKFSLDSETKFRADNRNNTYQKELFRKMIVAAFNDMMKTAVNPLPQEVSAEELNQLLSQEYAEKETYVVSAREVKLADCTPPVTIAYHLLGFQDHDETDPEERKKEIREKLEQLFVNIKTGSVNEYSNYLRYLASTPTTKERVVTVHKEFLKTYLQQENSKKLSFFERWFGYESYLNQIASNTNYLVMFAALTHVSPDSTEPMVELDIIKESINHLVDEYLETSWFVNNERRVEVAKLKDMINTAKDIETIIHHLAQSQIDTAKNDVEASKNRLKPINFFGHSRYQTTLNRALKLTSSLTGANDVDNILQDLTPLITDKDQTDLTIDKLDAIAQTSSSGNAKVIIANLENALAIAAKEPVGMKGRTRFFIPDVKKEPEKTDAYLSMETILS